MQTPPLDGLPPVVQWLMYVGVLAGAVFAGWRGYARPRLPRGDDLSQNAIVAGDIMATKPMADLAKAVESLAERTRLNTEADDRLAASNDRAAAAMDRNTDAVRDLCREIQRSRE